MMALLSSRHKTSLPYWDFQRTPFSYLSNSPHLVLPAPLRSAKHVIPIHATPQLSTGYCSVGVVFDLPHDSWGIICKLLHGTGASFV
jgi:hypothetical protein